MAHEHVNLAVYPVDQPTSSRYQSLVCEYRTALSSTGLVNLEEFLTPEGVAVIREEIYSRLPDAYYSVHGAQAYFDQFPYAYPKEVLGSETYCMGHHQLQSTAMDRLYRWEPIRRFVADLTNNEQVYLHEDPTNALVVQTYKPGCWTGWHFDRALFTTIINLGEPTAGGIFECAPDVRTEDNPSYEAVRQVLLNQSSRTQRYEMKLGSFTLMLGRYTIHRVTKVEPGQDRISLVLKYETQPGVYISAQDRKLIYGPSAPGPENPKVVAIN